MTQQRSRTEPTFGEPSVSSESVNTQNVSNSVPQNPSSKELKFSLHSSSSPGHTFTPVLTRPVESAPHLATLEEQQRLQKASLAEQSNAVNAQAQPEPSIQPAMRTNLKNFAFTPVQEKNENDVKESTERTTVVAEEPVVAQDSVKTENVAMSTNDMERVIPTQSPSSSKRAGLADKIPSRYRRLLLVLLIALALILVFFLLKPKSLESVDSLPQGSSLPIEFKPVNEAEAKLAEEEALAQQQQKEAQQAQEEAKKTAEQSVSSNTTNTNVTTTQAENSAPVSSEPVQVAPQSSEATPVKAVEAKAPVEPAIESKPVVTEAVKVQKRESVIYRPESSETTKSEKRIVKSDSGVSSVNVKKVEPVKPQPKATPASQNVSDADDVLKSASSKVITVQKGVSLFQNFRDNGLEANLPELNKMTKLNGETSRLTPGQKIVVRLDNNKRIVEMNIGSGKYLRQSDGSYIYR